MKKLNCEIIIPIFNEGKNIIKLFKKFEKNIQINFRVLLCYDEKNDDIFKYINIIKKFKFKTVLINNPKKGPCNAVIAGLKYSKIQCKIVYPADDFLNYKLIDKMYNLFLDGNDIVVPSRFIKGGSMKNCPLIKSIFVRLASSTLFYLSSIPVKDASNGFRLFSQKLLSKVKIESRVGFAYSLELLAKCNRLKMRIAEVPARWEERKIGSSRFKIFRWLPQYFKWYIYGLSTTWLNIKKI